uniref:Uncharacterized protein n=1 Tax=Caenorhabditis japonica TaxID=281687 RepID=A0A8R1IND3_CAEJA
MRFLAISALLVVGSILLVDGAALRDKRQSCDCAPAAQPSCSCQRSTYTQPQYTCTCQTPVPVSKSCPCDQPARQQIYQVQTTQCAPACKQSCQQQ